MIDTITMALPAAQAQNPSDATRATAIDRAPTCSGTTVIASPINNGRATPNMRPTRVKANNCGTALTSKAFVASATRSNPRMVATTLTPSSQMTLKPMKRRPIRLWSVAVSHAPTAPTKGMEGLELATGGALTADMTDTTLTMGGVSIRTSRSAGVSPESARPP